MDPLRSIWLAVFRLHSSSYAKAATKREGGIRRVMNGFGLQRREDGDGGRKCSAKHICLCFFICTLLTEMPQSNKQHLSVLFVFCFFFKIKTNPPTVIYSRTCVNKARWVIQAGLFYSQILHMLSIFTALQLLPH